MEVLKGRQIHKKIGIGPLYIYTRAASQKEFRLKALDRSKEFDRLKEALEATDKELLLVYRQALKNVGKKSADIFAAQRMLLTDESFLSDIRHIIMTESCSAEYAVNETAAKYVEFFSTASNSELRERATDIRDVSDKIIGNLLGKKVRLSLDKPSVIFADELSATELVSVEKNKIRGIVTKRGSLNSHTAIIARALDIPMMVIDDEKTDLLQNYEYVIVDAREGLLYIDPDEVTLENYRALIKEQKKLNDELLKYAAPDWQSADGKTLKVFGNVTGIEDVNECSKYNADGIGLFRTEFIYLGSQALPKEEEQYKLYCKVIKKMQGKPVVFRTLDIGSDKTVDYLMLSNELNPALGVRGIRFSLLHKDIFKTQLSAILRACENADGYILLPMIISVDEVLKVKDIIKEVKEDLAVRGKSYGNPKLGVMIETPAAVMICEELAKEADYICIGTNDLTQYTLALDRQNGELMDYLNPYHPALLKLIELAIKAAHKQKVPVGVCGEMILDVKILKQLVDLGIDLISVGPSNILSSRRDISNL